VLRFLPPLKLRFLLLLCFRLRFPPAHFPLAATTLDDGSGSALQLVEDGFVLSEKKPVLLLAAEVPNGPPVKPLGLLK
jgi:hypothetical protein